MKERERRNRGKDEKKERDKETEEKKNKIYRERNDKKESKRRKRVENTKGNALDPHFMVHTHQPYDTHCIHSQTLHNA